MIATQKTKGRGPQARYFERFVARSGMHFQPKLAGVCKSAVTRDPPRSRKDAEEGNNELSWPWSHLPALYNVREAPSCLEMRTAAKSSQVLQRAVLLCV